MPLRQIQLSATSIATFKACPTQYRLRYVEGIKPNRETDSQRIGTNWHALHEVYRRTYAQSEELPGLTPRAHDDAFAAAIDHLNESYRAVPDWADPDEWALERQILATSFAAYLWYYSGDGIETLAVEQEFVLPLHSPTVGLPLPMAEVVRIGKMDRIRRFEGNVGVQEYKSTTRSIDDGSDYWQKLRLDDQVSMYDLAFHDIPASVLTDWGVQPDDILGVTLYDVWHKPTISRKDLTQGDTAAFVESGAYFGDTYAVEVVTAEDPDYSYPTPIRVVIDGEEATFTLGKKGWALRETVTMFGSRLMADIVARPEFYFRRRHVARTADERKRYRRELFNIYQAMRLFEKTGCWFQNPNQCQSPYPCDMIPICYGPTHAEEVCDGKTTPTGFRRSVKLTIGGQEPA